MVIIIIIINTIIALSAIIIMIIIIIIIIIKIKITHIESTTFINYIIWSRNTDIILDLICLMNHLHFYNMWDIEYYQ